MSIEIPDLSGEASGFGDLLPPATYRVVIENAEDKKFSTGTVGIAVDFKVVTGPHAGRFVWDTLFVTPKALGRLRSSLEVCGIEIPAGVFRFTPEQLIGKVVDVVVRHEPAKDGYDAKAIVKSWRKPAGGGVETATMPSGVVAPAGAPAGAVDDDIPF